ncbi:helix-turn-helix transcriptional regulator [Paenibacillus sp. 7124]|uniref:Helix-turn-helix transcriptional regulator n=1 Tax=Paenibacillus apii TaxID=1850370 RepID=A0A6M1PH53_9BACL|nr:helix-turn-helix transcriptional regulator [Paenibacillus apii]NGM81303.1 helix-turn-helix transcriptional regulator [Paenibacillus apii]
MAKVLFNQLKEFRNELSLRLEYVSNLTGISPLELESIEKGELNPTEAQVTKLAYVYGCPESFFYESETKPMQVLARNGQELSEFDKRQINEFLAFQREASRIINHAQH